MIPVPGGVRVWLASVVTDMRRGMNTPALQVQEDRERERIDPQRGFRFVSDHQAIYPVRTRCRLLGLSPSGYYAWRGRGPSFPARENAALTGEVLEIHARSDGTYGAPRIHAELRSRGREVSLNRVARLMRATGIEGVSRRRKRTTTRREPGAEVARDLVDRDFSASAGRRALGG